MSQLYKDQIFWIEVDKISPNPYQPRREFNEDSLADLADSIRQYGVMQPLTVSRIEEVGPEGGVNVHYELIAGERRWRASKLAGLHQVPVIVRKGDDAGVKLELAIIENLQREDLNPIDRALAFDKLANEFGLSHVQIGKKMGKSREYVSNSLRLLQLPEDIKQAVIGGLITEGHTRPLLMLKDRPEEQAALFKEIVYKKMSVRDAERVARSIAKDKARKKTADEVKDPGLYDLQKKFEETLGTRVQIEKNRGKGGRLVIDYFSPDDLSALLEALRTQKSAPKMELPEMADMLASASGLQIATNTASDSVEDTTTEDSQDSVGAEAREYESPSQETPETASSVSRESSSLSSVIPKESGSTLAVQPVELPKAATDPVPVATPHVDNSEIPKAIVQPSPVVAMPGAGSVRDDASSAGYGEGSRIGQVQQFPATRDDDEKVTPKLNDYMQVFAPQQQETPMGQDQNNGLAYQSRDDDTTSSDQPFTI